MSNSTATPPADIAADIPLIIAFGDSLYAGYNLAPSEGLVAQLEKAIADRAIAVQWKNASVSGDTTQAGLARLTFVLDNIPRKPTLFLLGLGGNDMLRGVDPETTRANLEAMLQELQRRDIPVLLTGMLAAPNLGADYRAAFDPIYPQLAQKYQVTLYPFILDGVAGNADLLLDDSIHPNPQGIEVMVTNLAPLIVTTLKKTNAIPISR